MSDLSRDLAKEIAQLEKEIRSQTYLKWRESLEESLSEILSIQKVLLDYQQIVKQAQSEKETRGEKIQVRRDIDIEWNKDFEAGKRMVQQYGNNLTNITIEKLKNMLKQGILKLYAKITTIREVLTNQKIKYQVAIRDTQGNIAEGSFSLQELIPYLSLELTSAADYSLRFTKDLLSTVGKEKDIENGVLFKENHLDNKDLYEKIENYYKNNLYTTKGKKKKIKIYNKKKKNKSITLGNQGNLYEVYRLLLSRGNTDPDKRDIINAFAQVQSGGGIEGAFYKGPDVGSVDNPIFGYEQDKAFINTSASFFNSTEMVIKLAQRLIDIFYKVDPSDMINKLESEFIGKRLDENTRKKVKEKITREIENTNKAIALWLQF